MLSSTNTSSRSVMDGFRPCTKVPLSVALYLTSDGTGIHSPRSARSVVQGRRDTLAEPSYGFAYYRRVQRLCRVGRPPARPQPAGGDAMLSTAPARAARP